MIADVLRTAEEKMRTSVKAFKNDLATIRTGHAAPALIEHVKVDYSGVPTPLNQIASISAPEARLLVIQPWDQSNIGNIVKAIQKSDLGLNPVSDGRLIRINIPPLTEERRKELVKIVRGRIEERKTALRNLRRDAMGGLKEMEKNKDISQDEYKRALDKLQKLTDACIAIAEQIGLDKEAELTEV